MLIRHVAVPELPSAYADPREEFVCCVHCTAGVIPSNHRAHINSTQSLNPLQQGLVCSNSPLAQLTYVVPAPKKTLQSSVNAYKC